MRFRKMTVGVALVVGVVAIPATAASAGPGGTKGPGDCNASPGAATIHHFAQDDGPNAGPNSDPLLWDNAPGTPNSPGQAVKNVCLS